MSACARSGLRGVRKTFKRGGPDESSPWEHRTEPLEITLYVDELLVDRTDAWKQYEQAQAELTRRYDAIGIPSSTGVPGDPSDGP